MRPYLLLLLLFNACTSTDQIRQETHVVPADTTYGYGSDYLYFMHNPDCDTAGILQVYGDAIYQAQDELIEWRSRFYSERAGSQELRDSAGHLLTTIDKLKRSNNARVIVQSHVIHDIDTVRVTVVEEYGFWLRLRDYAACVIGGLIIGIVIAATAGLLRR